MLVMNVAQLNELLVTCMQATLVMRDWPGVLVLNPWLIRLGLLFVFPVGLAAIGAPLCSMFWMLSLCTIEGIRLGLILPGLWFWVTNRVRAPLHLHMVTKKLVWTLRTLCVNVLRCVCTWSMGSVPNTW